MQRRIASRLFSAAAATALTLGSLTALALFGPVGNTLTGQAGAATSAAFTITCTGLPAELGSSTLSLTGTTASGTLPATVAEGGAMTVSGYSMAIIVPGALIGDAQFFGLVGDTLSGTLTTSVTATGTTAASANVTLGFSLVIPPDPTEGSQGPVDVTATVQGAAPSFTAADTLGTATVSIPATAGNLNIVLNGGDLGPYPCTNSPVVSVVSTTVVPPPPAITTVTPSAGPNAGGTPITITGTNLASASSVTVGGISVATSIDTNTTITTTTPAGTQGPANVVVTTAYGTSNDGTFTYEGIPAITTVAPGEGPTSGGTPITITGTNLANATSVTVGGSPLTPTSDTAGTITGDAPPGPSGPADVVVTTAGGTSNNGTFTYVPAPLITTVAPSAGPASGGTAITITGTNLAGATSVTVGGAPLTSMTDTATSITGDTPAGAVGPATVSITTVGGTVSLTGGFTYLVTPAVTGVLPNAGPLAGGTPVTITGSDFTGATVVDFGANPATSFTVNSANSITATPPAGASGVVNVTVTSPAGTSPLVAGDQFTYTNGPIVTGVSPASGPLGGGTSVTVTGLQFTGATAVDFGTTPATSFTVNSANSITATSPPGSTGTVDVTVVGPNGTSVVSSQDQYTYVQPEGYWEVAADGGIFAFGSASFYGSEGGKHLTAPITAFAPSVDGKGYYEVGTDGGIFAFGDATFYGSMGGKHLNKPIVGIATTQDGAGYWEVASDGGIFAFGDARFFGSMGGKHLNDPIVGIAATPDGGGYWEVASDGGLFAFGDAQFYGSMGGKHLNEPIVGITVTPDGAGYWEVASDGGLFAFGDAKFFGSMGGKHLNKPIVGIAATPDGAGYWEVASDGGLFAFGDAAFFGSEGGKPLNAPIVAMGSVPS